MRGHIGFKIPRYPGLRVTQFVPDVLRHEEMFWYQPPIYVTQLAVDQLTYTPPAPVVAVSSLAVDVLTYDSNEV